ncbi:MAG: aquaporin [Candidatus Tumulicola sp.]
MSRGDALPVTRKLVAEAIGTFIVTLAATCVDVLYYSTHEVDYVSRWLTRGFATAVVIFAFSEISGAHVDPAITLGFTLRRVFSPAMLVAYWIAQFAGSFAAAALLATLFGRAIALGASHPGPSFTPLQAVGCEIVLTAIVMLTILITAKEKAAIGKEAALAVGLAVAACGFFGGPISGASMNPARSIAPQILTGQFGIVWIYAVGPLVGAALAVAIHRFLCGSPNRSERAAATGGS